MSLNHVFDGNRIKDMIISGGLNVYPIEVEEVLCTQPAIEEFAVVAMPHADYGEAVTAYVKIKQRQSCSENDLIIFCKKRIASYKALKKILSINEFPKSSAGKIVKREIRKSLKIKDSQKVNGN